MVSKIVKYYPETLVALTFLPMGIFMGFITHFYLLNPVASRTLYFSKWWPYVVSSAAALLTGGLQTFIKVRAKKYRYEHFYVLIFGMFVILLGGILLGTANMPYAGIYLTFVGHGICYISALSYLNIRMGKSNGRMLKLSIPYWIYLLGVAVGASTTGVSLIQFEADKHFQDSLQLVGLLIIGTSTILLCGYLLNELLYFKKHNDYKTSLDEDINRENEQEEIFNSKYFLISLPTSDCSRPDMIAANIEQNVAKHIFMIVFTMLSKITMVAYFYTPFIYIYILGVIAFDVESLDNIFVINWYGMVGITVSMLLLACGSYKLHFLLALAIKMIYLLLIGTITVTNEYLEGIMLIMSFLFIILTFGYGYSDINILSYTNLKFNEIILASGYVVQYTTIGVLQYYTLNLTRYVLNLSSNYDLIFPHSISFVVFFIVIAIFAIFLMPNRNHLSLLEMQNAVNVKSNTAHVMPEIAAFPNNNLPSPPPPYIQTMPGHYPFNQQQYYPPTPHQMQQQQYYYQQQPPYLAYGNQGPADAPPNYNHINTEGGQSIPIDLAQMRERSEKITEL